MIASKELKKKYQDVVFTDSYIEFSRSSLYYQDDIHNCGAVIRHDIDSARERYLEKAFADLCSINGKTLIYGTCEKKIFKKALKPYGYQIVFEYPSNRESRCADDFNAEFAVTMVLFVKHIEKPLLQGYGFYIGEIK